MYVEQASFMEMFQGIGISIIGFWLLGDFKK